MTEATNQTAESTPARNAGRTQPNVVTGETIAARFAPSPPEAKAEPEVKADTEAKPAEVEAKTEAQPSEGDRKDSGKKSISDRMRFLVEQRKSEATKRQEAEAKTAALLREKEELEARLKRLEANPDPIETAPRPKRDAFGTQEEYEDAVADWRADQKIAERERKAAEARALAEKQAIDAAWNRRMQAAMKEFDDYKDVVGGSKISLPEHLYVALQESEYGPHLAYYFAKHPEEAERFTAMRPTTALRQLGRLEDALFSEQPEEPEAQPAKKEAQKPAVEVSKAPAPVKPVRESTAANPGPALTFEEYRARRQQQGRH